MTIIISDGQVSSGLFIAATQSLQVLSGGTAIATSLAGQAEVNSGGTMSATSVSSGGIFIIDHGAVAGGTTVLAKGEEIVRLATVTGTVVSAGGYEVVSGGLGSTPQARTIGTVLVGGTQMLIYAAEADHTDVRTGGQQQVDGGQTMDTIVRAGGLETLYGGGVSEHTTLMKGGRELVQEVGRSLGTVVGAGAVEVVSGISSATTVKAGGWLVALPQANVTGTMNSGGHVVSTGVFLQTPDGISSATRMRLSLVSGTSAGEYVLPGGSAISTTIAAFGIMQVFSGGAATATTVLSRGILDVASSGFAHSANAAAGANIVVEQGSILSDASAAAGARITVYSGGLASTVTNAGSLAVLYDGKVAGVVQSGGTIAGSLSASIVDLDASHGAVISLSGTTVQHLTLTAAMLSDSVRGAAALADMTLNSGGVATIYGMLSGTKINSGGMLTVNGTASGTTIDAGGVLVDSGGHNLSDTTIFSGGTLRLVGVSQEVSADTVLHAGGLIDLPSLSFAGSGTAVLSRHTLTIVEGAASASVALAGGYADDVFLLAQDLAGGTLVSFTASAGIPAEAPVAGRMDVPPSLHAAMLLPHPK